MSKSKTTTKNKKSENATYPVPKPAKILHPGVVLGELYLKENNITQSQLARMLNCTATKINEIVNGKRAMTPEFAIALEKALGTSAEMWVRMQADYDLQQARKKKKAG